MVKISQVEFEGYECVRIVSKDITLHVTVSVGPRILGCSYRGGHNLFAVLGEDGPFPYPGGGSFYGRGGHRLWYAPESASTTYVPDNQPVEYQENPDGLTLLQVVDAPTGIQKCLQIVMDPESAVVTVKHRLTNTTEDAVELAPWAITQMQPGGFAILPQNTATADEEGFWANRALVLWPYARMQDPNLVWGDRYIFVKAAYAEGRTKLGWPNLRGWLGYALDNTLFVKSADYRPEATYYDSQSSSQCYCCPEFLELETLGPATVLQAGKSTVHTETWQIFDRKDLTPDEDRVEDLVVELGLDG